MDRHRADGLRLGRHAVRRRQHSGRPGARDHDLGQQRVLDIGGAAALWADLGAPFDMAMALAQGTVEQRLHAIQIFTRMGAAAPAQKLVEDLRREGYRPDIPDEEMVGWTQRVRVPAVVTSERETRGISLVGISSEPVDSLKASLSTLSPDESISFPLAADPNLDVGGIDAGQKLFHMLDEIAHLWPFLPKAYPLESTTRLHHQHHDRKGDADEQPQETDDREEPNGKVGERVDAVGHVADALLKRPRRAPDLALATLERNRGRPDFARWRIQLPAAREAEEVDGLRAPRRLADESQHPALLSPAQLPPPYRHPGASQDPAWPETRRRL